ncbi:ferredoxin [Frankia sp. AvcI1]|uniref:ferredoxin n=1 Tax=Frankia sp. AvcI1 TaxID=573496 RepID=UPI001F1DF80F|nr:ferredoxin [Frankia sp. AvcI1]
MATAPDVFDQDEEGLVVVVEPDRPAGDEPLLRKAQYLCPAAAITLLGGSATG